MIDPAYFYKLLEKNGLNFFVGVPDSLLRSFCAYVDDKSQEGKHIISANEGNAIGIAAGYHLSTKKTPVVYMQNSGLGNCINPLASLTDAEVYSIPMVLVIGWRGEPGTKDEPQHIKQGRITEEQLKILGIDYFVMDSTSDIELLVLSCLEKINQTNSPVAILVRTGTFSDYIPIKKDKHLYNFSREEAINLIVELTKPDDLIISTTGKCSRELYEIRKVRGESQKDFLTVGSMGHTSSISLGVALGAPTKKVICLDGDGSTLMHLGSLPIIGSMSPKNLLHVILNNGSHESVGGQPTVAREIDLNKLSQASNYVNFFELSKAEDLRKSWDEIYFSKGPTMLALNIDSSSRSDLGRPESTALENKKNFMSFLNVNK